jgi:hypothetical protein
MDGDANSTMLRRELPRLADSDRGAFSMRFVFVLVDLSILEFYPSSIHSSLTIAQSAILIRTILPVEVAWFLLRVAWFLLRASHELVVAKQIKVVESAQH